MSKGGDYAISIDKSDSKNNGSYAKMKSANGGKSSMSCMDMTRWMLKWVMVMLVVGTAVGSLILTIMYRQQNIDSIDALKAERATDKLLIDQLTATVNTLLPSITT